MWQSSKDFLNWESFIKVCRSESQHLRHISGIELLPECCLFLLHPQDIRLVTVIGKRHRNLSHGEVEENLLYWLLQHLSG